MAKRYGRREPLGLRCLTIQVTQLGEELLEFDLNAFLQREGIQLRVLDPQLGLRRLGDLRTGQQSLIGPAARSGQPHRAHGQMPVQRPVAELGQRHRRAIRGGGMEWG